MVIPVIPEGAMTKAKTTRFSKEQKEHIAQLLKADTPIEGIVAALSQRAGESIPQADVERAIAAIDRTDSDPEPETNIEPDPSQEEDVT